MSRKIKYSYYFFKNLRGCLKSHYLDEKSESLTIFAAEDQQIATSFLIAMTAKIYF